MWRDENQVEPPDEGSIWYMFRDGESGWGEGGREYLEADCEEGEDFHHHGVTVFLECVEVGFIVCKRRR